MQTEGKNTLLGKIINAQKYLFSSLFGEMPQLISGLSPGMQI